MTKVKWRKEPQEAEQEAPKPDDAKTAEMKEQAVRLMPIAEEVAKALEGNLLALFTDERDVNVMRVVYGVDSDTSLAVLNLPVTATSVDDAPDELEHYCSGLELAEELADALFKDEKGRAALMGALATFDRKHAIRSAMRWMELTMEFAPKPKDT